MLANEREELKISSLIGQNTLKLKVKWKVISMGKMGGVRSALETQMKLCCITCCSNFTTKTLDTSIILVSISSRYLID